MSSLKVDLQPNSQKWNNQANPVQIVLNDTPNNLNAMKGNNSGINTFTLDLKSLYSTSPIVSQMIEMQFATYNDSESSDVSKDWFVRFVVSNGTSDLQFSVYPRNSSNYSALQDQWIVNDQTTIMVDQSGSLISFGNFTSGAYSNYEIKQIIVSTEESSLNKFGDFSITCSEVSSLDFVVNSNQNNVVLGSVDHSALYLQNKNISLLTNGTEVLTIDGENQQIITKNYDLVIQSNLNVNGNLISGAANPTSGSDVTTKNYVDSFFDQMVTQLQWFNSQITSDTEFTFSSGNLTQDLNVLTTVDPEPLNNTIQKLTNNTFKLLASSFRVEFTLKVSYSTMQSEPISIHLEEIDQNGDLVAGSSVNHNQITLKPFGMDQVVTSQVFKTLVLDQETRFKVSVSSAVPQTVSIKAGSSLYINRLFDQNQSGTYQPISTQSISLNNIIAPTGNVSLNNYKIVNLATPTNNSEATTKLYVDQLNDTTVSYIDTQIAGTFNQTQADNLYYTNTLTLNNITAPNGNLDMNSLKISNMGNATSGSDALNRQTADSRYYQSNIPLQQLTAPSANLSLNSKKITNLANATLATDALNQQSGDNRYYLLSDTLNSIQPPTANVSLNSYKITNLGNPTSSGDAINKSYFEANSLSQTNADSRYYLQTTTLDTLTAPVSSLSLNSQKITSLATPTLSTDASTKGYVDLQIANIVNTAPSTLDTLNELANALNNDADFGTTVTTLIGTKLTTSDFDSTFDTRYALTPITSALAPISSLSLNSQKITNLADATLATDALNRQTGDSRYYQSSVVLDSITAPTGSLNLNSQKITNLADATLATDAMNRQTCDSRYYLSNVVLNSLTAPTGSLSLNSQKITNLANATLATDAMNRQTCDSRYYQSSVVLDSITAPTGSLNLNSQKITNLADATLATDALNRQTGDSRYYLKTATLDTISVPVASLSLNSQKITNLATPTLSTDATTKAYVDSQISGGSSAPIGSVFMYINTTPPTNYLICDGSSLSRTTYSALFDLIGTQYGTASITTFNLPDFRGVVPRGFNGTASDSFIDPDRTSRVARYTGGATGNNLGSYQQDQFSSHTHSVGRFGTSTTDSSNFEPASGSGSTISTGSTGGNETRAKNVSVVFIIKFQ